MVSSGAFIGRRVGRFTITSHLASGGMAELFIARQEAVGGFEKDLVLKMLQERYAQNPRVVEMFLDEARLAAKLNHQNIVHVYDVDESEGIRYIAMEYIHGQTVTDIIRRSIARGTFLPIEHAVHIVAETAAGLAYAHESRAPDGRAARIVHRDVSPSNILVTYEGLTKIVDFGIARVQDQIREESGMRPGKVSYMSPEQVRGESADHRSDIFSLGIILYEITVGRRLWRGPPETVMRRIVEELIPPPTYVRRDYPPALELIVMKALERRPADRYQSAADLQRDLNEFMEESGLKSGSLRLSQYMKDLFAADPVAADAGPRPTTPPRGSALKPLGRQDDDAEELDFDRRAPLMMRVEARPDEDLLSTRNLSAVAKGKGPSARNGAGVTAQRNDGAAERDTVHDGGLRTAGQGSGVPVPLESRHTGSTGTRVPAARRPATAIPGMSRGAPSAPIAAVAAESNGAAMAQPSSAASPMPAVGDADTKTNALRWAIALALFVGAVVVVFLATK